MKSKQLEALKEVIKQVKALRADEKKAVSEYDDLIETMELAKISKDIIDVIKHIRHEELSHYNVLSMVVGR